MPAARPPLSRAGRLRSWFRGGPRWRRVLAATGLVVFAALVAEAAFWVDTFRRVDHFDYVAPPDDGVTTVLVVGSDSRRFVSEPADRVAFGEQSETAGERADVMVLVRYGPGRSATIRSVPRDLLVDGPDGGRTRLALTLGRGPQALGDTVCRSLGVAVDHLVIVGFDGFRSLIDALGGVEVDAEAIRDPMTGVDIAAPGPTQLSGATALAYLRSRAGEVRQGGAWVPDPDGAEGRQRRTLQVLAAAGEAAGDTSWPSVRFHRFGRAATGAVRVSEGTGWRDLVELGRRLRAAGQDPTGWPSLGVRTGQVGAVPMAELDATGSRQLAELGRFPRACDAAEDGDGP